MVSVYWNSEKVLFLYLFYVFLPGSMNAHYRDQSENALTLPASQTL